MKLRVIRAQLRGCFQMLHGFLAVTFQATDACHGQKSLYRLRVQAQRSRQVYLCLFQLASEQQYIPDLIKGERFMRVLFDAFLQR